MPENTAPLCDSTPLAVMREGLAERVSEALGVSVSEAERLIDGLDDVGLVIVDADLTALGVERVSVT